MTTSFTSGWSWKTRLAFATIFTIMFLSSCEKTNINNESKKPSAYTANVLDKWMTLQLRLMRNATGIPNHGFSRHYAYAGVAAIESLRPGLHPLSVDLDKWNGLTGLPAAGNSKDYYYPANVNAAMAAINKAMFPNASSVDKAAIDSLEAVLYADFQTYQSQQVLNTSTAFGKAVASAVFNWAETDGFKNANNPFTPPLGAGYWVPTAPGFGAPATPYWGANRTIITGSIDGADAPAPPAYSTESASAFYQMVKQVYDVSQTLTDDQKNMAAFWRDVPGTTSPGHWLSILQQVVKQKNASLEKAALAYALTGAAINDGLIGCFKSKYQSNLVRPITYIRDVLGHTAWTSFLTTPAHPEYVSAHASLSAAAASVMQTIFGNIGQFTDHTYDYLNYPPRVYSSLIAIGEEAGMSRLYAGIHYQLSIDAGFAQGKKIAANIINAAFKIVKD